MSYRVDLAELARVMESLDAYSKLMKRRLDGLDEAMTDLHVTWDGEAAIAHRVSHQRLMAGAAGVHAGLIAMHRAADRALESYQAGVRANLATWKQLG